MDEQRVVGAFAESVSVPLTPGNLLACLESALGLKPRRRENVIPTQNKLPYVDPTWAEMAWAVFSLPDAVLWGLAGGPVPEPGCQVCRSFDPINSREGHNDWYWYGSGGLPGVANVVMDYHTVPKRRSRVREDELADEAERLARRADIVREANRGLANELIDKAHALLDEADRLAVEAGRGDYFACCETYEVARLALSVRDFGSFAGLGGAEWLYD